LFNHSDPYADSDSRTHTVSVIVIVSVLILKTEGKLLIATVNK